MKLHTKKSESFTPVEITFTVESQQELDGLWNIFNHTAIVEHLGVRDYGDKIRDGLVTLGAREHNEFNKFVTSLKV